MRSSFSISFSKDIPYCWFLVIHSRKMCFYLHLSSFMYFFLYMLCLLCTEIVLPEYLVFPLHNTDFGDFSVLMYADLLAYFKQLCSIPLYVVQKIFTVGDFGCFYFFLLSCYQEQYSLSILAHFLSIFID